MIPSDRKKLDIAIAEYVKEHDREYMIKAEELINAGWSFEFIEGEQGKSQAERVMAWYWRKPGPRGGRRFLSTDQALNHLRRTI